MENPHFYIEIFSLVTHKRRNYRVRNYVRDCLRLKNKIKIIWKPWGILWGTIQHPKTGSGWWEHNPVTVLNSDHSSNVWILWLVSSASEKCAKCKMGLNWKEQRKWSLRFFIISSSNIKTKKGKSTRVLFFILCPWPASLLNFAAPKGLTSLTYMILASCHMYPR